MTRPTLCAAFLLALLGASPGQLRYLPGTDGTSSAPRILRYEVPLLELPAFMTAASPAVGGAEILLRPVTALAFSESLGAQYWERGAIGWPPLANESVAANSWRSPLVRNESLREEIEAEARLRMRPAVVSKRSRKPVQAPEEEEDVSAFSKSNQPHTSITTEERTGLLGGLEFNAPGGVTTSLFVLVVLFALLISQLRGFEKGERRRRSASRRRSSSRRRH